MERIGQSDLIAYLDGELTRDRNAAITRALQDDSAAQAELEHLRKLRDALHSACDVEPAPLLVGNIMNGLDGASSWYHRHRAPIVLLTSLAAVTTALVLLPYVKTKRPTMVARGGSSVTLSRYVGVEVRRHEFSHPDRAVIAKAGDTVSGQDGFTFVVRSRWQQPVRLRITALDAEGTLHHLFPANAKAPALVINKTWTALAEGVTLSDLPSGKLRIIARFEAQSRPTDHVTNKPKKTEVYEQSLLLNVTVP